jgi:D-Tyr-tRNAtyr deacylase
MSEVNFISVIDYIGEINGGVAVLLSMKVGEKIYEIAYWFDKENNYRISSDDNFLQDYNIKDIYEYKDYKKLAYYIHNFVLNNKDEIFKEFLTD